MRALSVITETLDTVGTDWERKKKTRHRLDMMIMLLTVLTWACGSEEKTVV